MNLFLIRDWITRLVLPGLLALLADLGSPYSRQSYWPDTFDDAGIAVSGATRLHGETEILGYPDRAPDQPRVRVYPVGHYQPGKIPLVLVHGIASRPTVWRTMVNALSGNPKLCAAYQFWVVSYPSSSPLPPVALSLRHALRETCQRFDPQGLDGALSQMVVLGKSTGGQLTRMLVESSGDALWKAIFNCPITEICTSPQLRNDLVETFFFKPEPYIRRVIFVTTAHRGSKLGAHPGVRVGINLIGSPNSLRPVWAELKRTNGPEVFQPQFRRRVLSAADGLQAENSMLRALDCQPIAPGVAYHSIIANISRHMTPEKISDGIVSYQSAHLEGAISERIVSAGHLCEDDPEVIDEVSRILRIHLDQQARSLSGMTTNLNSRLE